MLYMNNSRILNKVKGYITMTIKEARKQANMTRREVSEWLAIPYRTLSGWENGERECLPYIEKLIVEKILRGKEK